MFLRSTCVISVLGIANVVVVEDDLAGHDLACESRTYPQMETYPQIETPQIDEVPLLTLIL